MNHVHMYTFMYASKNNMKREKSRMLRTEERRCCDLQTNTQMVTPSPFGIQEVEAE